MESASEGVMEELSQGREYANQLRAMLRDDDASATATALLDKILHSFSHSLSLLITSPHTQTPPPLLKSQDKDRRGCYKRRRTSEISIKETTSLFEDGHAWRKYGQKVILNAQHPRNYFRCTHKFDQGCQATKQVQKIQDDPFPLFKTTYLGHHTCLLKSSHQIMMATNHHESNSIIWSFDSLGNGSTIIKQESSCKSEASSSSSIVLNTSPDHFVCSADGAQLRLVDNKSSATDHAGDDVYSCATASTHHSTLEMDPMTFDELLELYEGIN